MASNLIDSAAAAGSGTAAAMLASGRPAEEVVVWSLLGALVAVWLKSHQDDHSQITLKLMISITFTLIVSVLCGIVGSALFVAVVPAYPLTNALKVVPQWAVAFVIAALIHNTAPVLYDVWKSWLQKKGAKNAETP